MHFVNLHNCLHKAHKAVRAGPTALNAQATAINDLFLYLDSRQNQLFPSLLYTQANQMLQWYREHLLPGLEGYNEEDRHEVAEHYRTLIAHVNESAIVSQNIEKSLYQVIQKLVTGTFHHEHEVEKALLEIARNFPGIEDTSQPASFFRTFLRRFKRVQGEFNYTRSVKLFERLLDVFPEKSPELSSIYQASLSNFQELLEYVLHAYFEGKAVLVDNFGHGIVLPLWVSVDCTRTSEHVEFWNHTVDAEMQASADIARFLARKYLLEEYDREIPEKMAVQCQFPNPAVGYRDTSASLLIGIKIVGEVLGLESDPATAVTGEVEFFGNVLGVGWIPEKVNVAREHDGIERILVPSSNISEIKMTLQERQLTVIPVRTFPEAVQHYYGESLRKKKRWLSRRRVLEGAIGTLIVLPIFWAFKNIFTHPVTNEDLWSVEYATELYQQQGNYQKAMPIFQSILKKFDRNNSSTEALQIKAQASTHLGLIYKQQYNMQDGLSQLCKAFNLWKFIHDGENQVQILIYIADVYYHSVAEDGITKNSKLVFGYLDQANNLLTSSMQTYRQLKCDYYGASGSLYNALNEYERAKTSMEKSLEFFDETEANWSYYLSKQCLGRILVRLGEYDQAFDILESTLHIPVLQRPYNQVRAFRDLSDLFLSIGDEQEGLEFADKAARLCKECGLKTQHIALQKMLARHHFPSTMVDSF